MRHARPDYQRIQDPAGKIPDDEPVFLLRGQDVIAAEAVDFYADKLEAADGSPELIRLAREQANLMRTWPKQKMPDPATEEVAAVKRATIGGLRRRIDVLKNALRTKLAEMAGEPELWAAIDDALEDELEKGICLLSVVDGEVRPTVWFGGSDAMPTMRLDIEAFEPGNREERNDHIAAWDGLIRRLVKHRDKLAGSAPPEMR